MLQRITHNVSDHANFAQPATIYRPRARTDLCQFVITVTVITVTSVWVMVMTAELW